MRITFILIIIIFTRTVFSASELPEPGEAFPTYFARITHGASFPGLYLNPPATVKNKFLEKIKKSYWVNLSTLEQRHLSQQGIDLWSVWYKEKKPGPILLPTEDLQNRAAGAYEKMVLREPTLCKGQCPDFTELLNSVWDDLPSWKRSILTRVFVSEAPVFGGNNLLSFLADSYDLKSIDIQNNVDIKILNHIDFVQTVRLLGWDGEVYFRGLTAPDPKDANRHWVVLDDELLGKYSPFDSVLLRMMEISGLLVHELSHVCQDLRGRQLGATIEVTSAEDALVIEGFAEYMAEKAIAKASEAMTVVNPWKLFSREQAVEIVYREGNEASGRLFPYTVGLPFVESLFSLAATDSHLNPMILRDSLLCFLDSTPLQQHQSKIELSIFLQRLFASTQSLQKSEKCQLPIYN